MSQVFCESWSGSKSGALISKKSFKKQVSSKLLCVLVKGLIYSNTLIGFLNTKVFCTYAYNSIIKYFLFLSR